jgi:hypothetical protein
MVTATLLEETKMAPRKKNEFRHDALLDMPFNPNARTQMPSLYGPDDVNPLGDQSTRPHWKREPEAYKAWASQTYSTNDYAPHQFTPCWRDADFYAEYAKETYGADNYHLFDPAKNRTSMTDGEIMAEARDRYETIKASWARRGI